MPLPDQYFVARMKNVAADGGSDHFMVIQRSGYHTNDEALTLHRHGYPHVELSIDKDAPVFGSKIEAEAHAWKMGADAQKMNPERIGAELQYPPELKNLILEVGKPGATGIEGTLGEAG